MATFSKYILKMKWNINSSSAQMYSSCQNIKKSNGKEKHEWRCKMHCCNSTKTIKCKTTICKNLSIPMECKQGFQGVLRDNEIRRLGSVRISKFWWYRVVRREVEKVKVNLGNTVFWERTVSEEWLKQLILIQRVLCECFVLFS